MSTSVLEIGLAYLEAWNRRDLKAARRLVAEDFHFKGSIDEFCSADEAFNNFERALPILLGVEVVSSISDGKEAAFFYRFKCKDPVGTIPTAEHLKFENGKIKDSRIYYDPRSFSSVMELHPVKHDI